MFRLRWGEIMELKIRNRDYVPDGAGSLQHVTGRDELLQRVLFRLCARRGAFPFAPALGSELHLLGREKPANRNAAAKKYIAEALSEENGITVNDVSLEQDGDICILKISLLYEGEELALAVPMEGADGI